MAKIDISTRTPGIFKTNRRKKGIRRDEYDAHTPVFRFATNSAAEKRLMAKTIRDTYANGGTK